MLFISLIDIKLFQLNAHVFGGEKVCGNRGTNAD